MQNYRFASESIRFLFVTFLKKVTQKTFVQNYRFASEVKVLAIKKTKDNKNFIAISFLFISSVGTIHELSVVLYKF